MFSKLLRYGIYTGVGTTGVSYIGSNLFEKEFNSLGVVRFGRATFNVNYFFKKINFEY
jgi:hypothetical protein